jgi:membrane fusion protein (multidrug efflux system)
MSLPIHRFTGACVLLCLTAGLAVAAETAPPPRPALPPRPPAPVGSSVLPAKTVALQSGNAGKKINDDMECLVEPHQTSSVGSAVEGTLAEVLVDRGSLVTKGQVVARLNANVESATVALRAAQEAFGKRKVERNEELFRKELISANDKDELETQTRIASLEHRQQQEVLAQRTIRSPLNGVVVERFLAPGEHVSNEKILKIAQIDPLNVEVVAPLELFGEIRTGMVGEVSFGPMLAGSYKARVTVLDRVIDAASGTFGVRLELPNPGSRIPSGIKCRVRFIAR